MIDPTNSHSEDRDPNFVETVEIWETLGITNHPKYQPPAKPHFWKLPWFRATVSIIVVLLPILLFFISEAMKAPEKVNLKVAGGEPAGVYASIADGLARTLETYELVEQATPVLSHGSLENLTQLQAGEVGFAIYQSGTDRLLRNSTNDHHGEVLPIETGNSNLPNNVDNVRFVANLFPEIAHILVHNDAAITSADDLLGKRVAVGDPQSGHLAMSLILLDHLAIPDSDNLVREGPLAVIDDWSGNSGPRRFDAAIITEGIGKTENHIHKLLNLGNCTLIGVPRVDSLCAQEVLLSPAHIPAGMYVLNSREFLPQQMLESVSLEATLLANAKVRDHTVAKVTSWVLGDDFCRNYGLKELFSLPPVERRRYAQRKAEFDIHPGSLGFYDPQSFDADTFQDWEALYSLIASAVIAGVVAIRWLKRRSDRNKDHRLDEYLNNLLAIELKQAHLDSTPGTDDTKRLQELLHEVTGLRQQALGEFSAHELNEDPAYFCFLDISHYVSEKINSKILLQRIDARFSDLESAVTGNNDSESENAG